MEYDALAGISTMHFRCFHLTDCTYIGEPKDGSESSRIEWVSEEDVVKLAAGGEIADGPSLTALAYYLGPYRLSQRA